MEGSGQALRRSFGLLRPHRRLVALTLLLTALLVMASLAIPALFGGSITAIEDENESLVIRLGLAIIGVGALRSGVSFVQTLTTGRLAVELERSIRNELFGRYLELDAEFHDDQRVGHMVSRLVVTSSPMRTFLAWSLPKIAADVMTVALAAAAMAVIDVRLAALALWPTPIVIWLLIRYAERATPVVIRRQEREGDVAASAEQSLELAVSVELLGAGKRRMDDLEAATGSWRTTADEVGEIDATYDAAIAGVPSLAWAGLFLWGGLTVINGDLGLGALVTFLGYFGVLLGPLQGLGVTLWRTQNAAASAARVFEVMDCVPLITSEAGAPMLERASPSVEVASVSESYGGPTKALDAVELSLAPGAHVGIVGHTGSGKSALLKALARVYDPEQGEIRIDRQRIDRVDLASLRDLVRLVGPSPHLFAGTVEDNISYGRPDADHDEVVAVVEALGFHDRILHLPDGYDTRVGTGVPGVAHPTAQLICIARALLTRPGILLLDDVTAPLPPRMQAAALEGIGSLTQFTTIVTVANRPGLLALADQVIVMRDGSIVAMGSLEGLQDNSNFLEVVSAWRLDATAP